MRNFLNITLSFLLLATFIGIPVSKGYCSMESCKKECVSECCSKETDNAENPCQKNIEYLQLDSDLSFTDASVKLPDIYLLYVACFPYLIDSVSILTQKHNESGYIVPVPSTDIPIKISCFRI